ncbi:MAG: transglutaminase-like domain-containing protein [Myxococcota bacterium]
MIPEPVEASHAIEQLSSRPDDAIDLVEGLHWIGAYLRSDQSIEDPHDAIDALANGVRERVVGVVDPGRRLEILCHYLGQECGFRGNLEDYYDPANSYLDRVLERRTGVPITLSVVYLEVAQRVGVELDAISFPYHFLIASREVEGVFLDPFHGGRVLTEEDCRAMLDRFTDGRIDFQPRFLEPVSVRDVLVRVTRNLKLVHVKRERFAEAIAAADLLLMWVPDAWREYHDRGLLHAQLEHWRHALDDLERYLKHDPCCSNRMLVEVELMKIRKELIKVN